MGPPGHPAGYDDGFKRRKMEEVDFSNDPDEPPSTLRILVRNQVSTQRHNPCVLVNDCKFMFILINAPRLLVELLGREVTTLSV